MHSESSDSGDSDYITTKNRPRKRRKVSKDEETKGLVPSFDFPLEALFFVLREKYADEDDSFEDLIQPSLGELIRARNACEDKVAEVNDAGRRIRRLRSSEITSYITSLDSAQGSRTLSEKILSRKLKLERDLKRFNIKESLLQCPGTPLNVLQPTETTINVEVLAGLYNIQTTPYANSYFSRLQGMKEYIPLGKILAVDWETRTPWMDLMQDLRDHFTFAHPDRENANEEIAPITYSTLHASYLPQVHDLLERSFWSGIDVTDSLDYQPEQVTVVAMYKKIVTGVAILKSPRETYIMYLAVKAGWDKTQIARTMLFHLITMNPHKDITLHVSTNNSAMLLYNQFGFKAEEFVAGFYAQYLDPQSRLSNNAFKLRLRHQHD